MLYRATPPLGALRYFCREFEYIMRRYYAPQPLMGLQVLLLSLLLWLAVGCSGDDQAQAPAVSTTASGKQATPASSSTLSSTADSSRLPLPPIPAEVAEAIQDRDAARLLQLLDGEPEPCGQTPTPGIGAGPNPTCPPGSSPGTLVGQFIVIGDCEGFSVPAGPEVVDRIIGLRDEGAELHAVVWARESFGSPERAYVLVYKVESGAGRAVSVKESGIVGVYYGCGASPQGLVSFWEANGDAVVYPPSDIRR